MVSMACRASLLDWDQWGAVCCVQAQGRVSPCVLKGFSSASALSSEIHHCGRGEGRAAEAKWRDCLACYFWVVTDCRFWLTTAPLSWAPPRLWAAGNQVEKESWVCLDLLTWLLSFVSVEWHSHFSIWVSLCMHVCERVCVHMSSRKSSEEEHGLVRYEEAKSNIAMPPHEEVIRVHCRVCCGFVTEAFIQLLTF